MHDPWLKGHKIAFCFFAVGCITLAATGLATLPRPEKLVVDLSVRLEGASAFASSLLGASDGLLGAANAVRPVMAQVASVLQSELGAAQSVSGNMQCAASLLDSGLSGPASPAVLQAQMAALISALQSGLKPALEAVTVLLDATYGGNGTTWALASVAGMPDNLSNIRNALVSYDNALAGIPSTRAPTSASDPAVAALRTAQARVDLPRWLSDLDRLHASILATAAAAQQALYTNLSSALTAQIAAAANATQLNTPLSSSLATLDGQYLGSPQQLQAQPAGALDAGRACLGRLAQQLDKFDQDIFQFSSAPERYAIATVSAVQGAMELLYGVNASASADVVSNGTTSLLPKPLAPGPSQLGQLLAPLAALDSSSAASQCTAIQSALSYRNGTSALPDASPTLNYIASLQAKLTALQQPAAAVAAALASYGASPSDASYNSLYVAVNTTKPPSADARSVAVAPAPQGSAALASAAGNASSAALSGPVLNATTVQTLSANVTRMTNWLRSSDPISSAPALNHTAVAMANLKAVLAKIQLHLQLSQNVTAGGSPSPASSSPTPAAPALSAFLQPLQRSVQLILDTLTNGFTAVGEQLDNALGKVISSPPPPSPPQSPSPAARRRLSQSAQTAGPLASPAGAALPSLIPILETAAGDSTPTTTAVDPAAAGAGSVNTDAAAATTAAITAATVGNATATVRKQLVNRIDNVTARLRSHSTRQYATIGYWVPVGVYAAVIASCLLLGLALFLNWPAGLVVLLFVQLVLAGLVLLGAWAVAAGAVVSHDACGSADSIVLGAVSPSSPLFPLVRYYLQGVGGSLPSVLRTTGLGDTTRLGAAADILDKQILNSLLLPAPPNGTNATSSSNVTTSNATSSSATLSNPWPGSLGDVQYVLGGVLLDMAAVAAALTGNLTTLLAMGDRSVVVAQYTYVTSWACCGLGGKLMAAWVCATGCGILAWLAALSGIMVLKNLDEMPVGRRCGCSCYNPRDFPRPASRRRGRDPRDDRGSSGGGSSSGGGATRGSLLKALKPQPPPSRTSAGSRPYSSSGGGSYVSNNASGGGAPLPPSKYSPPNGIHWPTGQRSKPGSPAKPSSKEVVVESGLYQGPPVQAGTAGGPGHAQASPSGSAVHVTVMDTETAAAVGFCGANGVQYTERPSRSASPPSAPPLPPHGY